MSERAGDSGKHRELADLNNEAAGRETGRIRRFLHDRDPQTTQAKKDENERRLSALMRLLQDPDYRAAYDAAWLAFEEAQIAVDDALLDNAEAIERLTAYTDEMDARAHKLGIEAVFQDETGRFFRVDGTALSDEETARVERSADAPSFEARRQAGDALEAAQARRAHILEIQATILDPARERLQDEDNPMSQEELRDLEATMKAVPSEVAATPLNTAFNAQKETNRQLEPEPEPLLSLDELRPN